jgi:hypothetical protein
MDVRLDEYVSRLSPANADMEMVKAENIIKINIIAARCIPRLLRVYHSRQIIRVRYVYVIFGTKFISVANIMQMLVTRARV